MTEQELEEYLTKIARGCDWFDSHPKSFRLYDNGFMIEIIDENIPEEARLFVEFSNKQTLADRKEQKCWSQQDQEVHICTLKTTKTYKIWKMERLRQMVDEYIDWQIEETGESREFLSELAMENFLALYYKGNELTINDIISIGEYLGYSLDRKKLELTKLKHDKLVEQRKLKRITIKKIVKIENEGETK